MAGFYPDIPAPRIPYDRNGTMVTKITVSNGSIATLTQTQIQQLNDESTSGLNVSLGDWRIALIFPEPVDIAAWFVDPSHNSGLSSLTADTSTDTTNGFDGTWTSQGSYVDGATLPTGYRNSIETRSIANVKAVRFRAAYSGAGTNGGAMMNSIHIYGVPAATASTDRLEFWHPTLDQPLSATPAFFDWGDRPRSTEVIRQVRVKNLSSALTASTITVGIQALTDTSPTVTSQHTFAYNGGAYSATCAIASLAPGEISQSIDVRQTILATAVLGLWAQRIYADAGGWA